MPLVRISPMKGKSPAYVRSVADAAHRALREAYRLPADDRFQVIEELEPDALIYDADYLNIHRTDDIIIIQIVAGNWRDTLTKQALHAHLVVLLNKAVGIRPEDVQIVVSSNERADWSFGRGMAAYVET